MRVLFIIFVAMAIISKKYTQTKDDNRRAKWWDE